MKKSLLFILVIINFVCFAQRFEEVVLWQIETKAKGMIFGVCETTTEAKKIITDFQNRNAGTKYDVSAFKPDFKYTTFPVKTRSESPVTNFNYLAGKKYKVLSKEDIKSMQISKTVNINAGINYYMRMRNTNRSFASHRINDLVSNFEKYRIEYLDKNIVYSTSK